MEELDQRVEYQTRQGKKRSLLVNICELACMKRNNRPSGTIETEPMRGDQQSFSTHGRYASSRMF